MAIVDLNGDGALDLVFANEGQESLALLGDVGRQRQRTPLVVAVTGKSGITGSRLRVLDRNGREFGMRQFLAADGRGQQSPQAHLALPPGNYRIEMRFSSGVTQSREIVLETTPVRALIGDR